ncbi:MAG: radical SAM protein, partial [Proteobacteria bacterium]|nr:radical SAM protein [Pseudomonadota bacterium]
MKREMKSGVNVLRKPIHVDETPIHIQLEPTTACNLACITCPHEEYVKRAKHMTLDEFKRIFDQIKPLKVTLSGFGEPFANPKLPDMIFYAKDHGASVNTTSNMTLVNDHLAEKIVNSRLDLIKVSIDAAKPETYQDIRGEDSHQKIIEGI